MACHFIDIYRGKKHDKKHDKKLPIMFNLHGGGFPSWGKKEESHLFCAEMSQKGFLVFSLEYPLAPESLFPQILRDLMKGIKNSRVYFQKYNGDEERIYLTGTSAGASLCVYLAAMMQSPELADVFWSGASRSWDSGNGPGERDVLHDKNGQHRNFSSFLYLRKRVEEKFFLSIHKSGKQSDSRTLAAVLSYHSLWRFPAKLQQTICQGHTEVRRHLPSGRSGSPQKTSSCIQYRPAGDPGKPICK